jgi:uncharacterized membrane protein YkoI
MKRNSRIATAAAVAVIAIGAGGVAVAMANTGDDAETPITGSDLDKASRAALAHTGGGRVTDTEVGDEESYYEVEVTLDNGDEVDVQLDKNFQVVNVPDADNESGDDDQD